MKQQDDYMNLFQQAKQERDHYRELLLKEMELRLEWEGLARTAQAELSELKDRKE